MEEKYNVNIDLIRIIKTIVEPINSSYDVDMRLYQPGINPLSIIGKDEQIILYELQENLIIILRKLNEGKEIPLPSQLFYSFFGVSLEELKMISSRLMNIIPLTQLKDDEFMKNNLYVEAVKQKNAYINSIIEKMLLAYIKEGVELIINLREYFEQLSQTSQTSKNGFNVSPPILLSNIFRIFYKDRNLCYCSIIDAIEDNFDSTLINKP